ncbi:MAG: response regulator [Alphaproteobacteria bacterium]|nr:response regulator [Alphaproteobacteria bacterium]
MKILIVSEDAVFERLVTKKLTSWGHRTVSASTGTEAFARVCDEPFRVVITDWNIAGISGPELCRRIRGLKRNRYTYMIIYENNDGTADQSKFNKEHLLTGLEAGADDYLTRPFNAYELQLRLRSAKRLLNREDELLEGPGFDHVTRSINEASFRHFFRTVHAGSQRADRPGALLFVHVDANGRRTTSTGYESRQRMMVEITNILSHTMRDADLMARLSDDDFCLLLHDTQWPECAPLAERILAQVNGISLIVEDDVLHPWVCIEAVNFPVDGLSSDDIISTAERTPFRPASPVLQVCGD